MCFISAQKSVNDHTNKGDTLGIKSLQLPASLEQSVDLKKLRARKRTLRIKSLWEDLISEQHPPIASAPQFLCECGKRYIYQVPMAWQGFNHEQGSVWPCGLLLRQTLTSKLIITAGF